jgi:hypothetical protein
VGAGEEEDEGEGEEVSFVSAFGLGEGAGLTSVWADLVHPYVLSRTRRISYGRHGGSCRTGRDEREAS